MREKIGRTIALFTKVLSEEKAFIEQKMAVDGCVVHLDMECVKEMVLLLRSISSNVNQIARRTNETRNFYAEDMENLRHGYAEIWSELKPLLKKFDRL